MVCFEVYSMNKELLYISLGSIPKVFESADGKDTYLFVGLIDFYGDEIPQTKNSIGHYTAIIYRGGCWMQYNDLLDGPSDLTGRYKVKPKLLFYKKQNINNDLSISV